MERKNSHATNRDGLLYRSVSRSAAATTSSDFVLQWGNRKRVRCLKAHGKDKRGASHDPAGPEPSQQPAVRVDRRVVRSDLNKNKNPIPNPPTITNACLNLRHRPASPSRRILRTTYSSRNNSSHFLRNTNPQGVSKNLESSIGMRGNNSNGIRGVASPPPDRGDRKVTSTSNNANNNNDNHHGGGSGSSETAHDTKKGAAAAVWPKFVIALTNKEKEEDFMAIKGSKLPQRPKKRAKLIQRTLNLVSPGAWLCDLTLERYEVREKKVSKKRPRGLRAMGNMIDSDSE